MIKAVVALLGGLAGLTPADPATPAGTRTLGEETKRLNDEIELLRSRFPETPAEAGRRRRRSRDRLFPTPTGRRAPGAS